MILTVHDVGHGSCISLLHDNRNSMLWDCGHKEGNRPSEFLTSMRFREITILFVTNYDEDHISDLPALLESKTVRSLCRNKSIDATSLRQLKKETAPISKAMESMLDMMERYKGGPLQPPPPFPDVEWRTFYNSFNQFDDTNNCSLVTFLTCKNIKFIFPGDVETEGWLKLLEDREFQDNLRDVNIFVASHHGRESGYCKEVFDFCHPDAVIFSDSNIKYATQTMAATYGQHCTGVTFNGVTRDVLTTRNDGSITWEF